jgi:C1A family cysteine protease
MKRTYSWKPSPIDVRDRAYESLGLALKPVVDLSPQCPPVWDQGQEGSCTAHALAAAMAMLHPDLNPARQFIYYNERAMEGTVRSDAGAYGRDGVKSLHKIGVCDESLYPYATTKLRAKPPAECYLAAQRHRISSYQALHSLDDMLQCLNAGYGFVFGFTVFDGFESDEVAKTGVLNLPAHGEKNLGGHEVFAVGYELAAKRFKVRNSWSATWGQGGYFTMPFEYLANRKLADDLWTIRK